MGIWEPAWDFLGFVSSMNSLNGTSFTADQLLKEGNFEKYKVGVRGGRFDSSPCFWYSNARNSMWICMGKEEILSLNAVGRRLAGR